MDILSNLQSLLGAAGGQGAPSRQGGMGDMGGLGSLLTPDVLGGLASAFLGGKAGGAGLGGGGAGAIGGLLSSLMSGGGGGGGGGMGGGLLSALGGLMGGGDAAPAPASASAPADQARRMILALVFAAKADGHIDANEEAGINAQISKLGLGREGQALVDQAMAAPLDPNLIARGLSDPNEAMTLYAISYALTDADQFMERSYLDNLATALRIPQNAKTQIEAKMRGR